MASILIVSDGRGSAGETANLLRGMGNRVLLCGGGPGPFAPCPLLKFGSCPLAEAADLIIFAFTLFPQATGRNYGGTQLLHAYRSHPDLGKVPMVIAVEGRPADLDGDGPIEFLAETPDPLTIALAASRLISANGRPFGPKKKGRMVLARRRRTGQSLLRR